MDQVTNTPFNNNLGSNMLFKTPSNALFNTPLNNLRRQFTPHSSLNMNTTGTAAANIMNNTLNMENPCDSIYEKMMPEYSLEVIWTEPIMVAGDSSFNEKGSKFFYITDLYNQKYV